LRGFTTAFGAALGDTLFFFLALAGALTFLEESKRWMQAFEFVGGVALIALGIHSIIKLRKKQNNAMVWI
jgi:threonine/homoserine/homoserine lactone efflux protein